MRTEGLNARKVVAAGLLVVLGALLAALCFRVAVVQALPSTSPTIAQLAPHDPAIILENAATALVQRHGILDAVTLADVRKAASAAPMDARAYLILGHQQLIDDKPRQALATLEAGQRLDPRQGIIHVLLLDRYLRTGRYTDAASQFSILARLVGDARGPISAAMAQMSVNPDMQQAVRYSLRTDPVLENQVLVALARSNTEPAVIFALASPAGRQNAGASDGWGPALIARLADQGRYGDARSVWQRVYGLTDAQVATPLFDAGLRRLPGSPPFNWTLSTGSFGAADLRNGVLAIDYYGRDNGNLAEQLLVLRPGSYRFGFTVEGSKAPGGPTLAWSLHCAAGAKAGLMNAVISTTGTRHREITNFVVPAGCPAQSLTLTGNAGEFPAPMNVAIRDLDLRSTTEERR